MQTRAPEGTELRSRPDDEQEEIWTVLRQASKDSLYVLNKGILGFTDLTSSLHLPYCNALQTDERLFAGILPRNHFKSTNGTVGKSIWYIINDPQTTINMISAVEENTIGWMSAVQHVFRTNEMFRWLFDEVIPKDWHTVEKNKTRFTVPRDESLMPEPQPTLQATSIISGQASKHVNHAILDDPVNEMTVDSPRLVDRAVGLYTLLEATLQDYETSTLHINATPWGFGDVVEKALESEVANGLMLLWKIGAYGNFECSPKFADQWYLPADIKVSDLQRRKITEDAKAEVLYHSTGLPIFPQRYPKEELERLEKKLGPFLFSCNFRVDPFDASQSGFSPKHINYFRRRVDGGLVCECPQHRLHKHRMGELHVVATVDPAWSDKDDAAESAICVGGIAPDGCRFLFKAWAEKVEPGELWREIAQTCLDFSPFLKDVGIESVASQKLFKFFFEYLQSIKQHLPAEEARKLPNVTFHDLKPDNDLDKKRRIKAQQLFLDSGSWHFLPGMDKFMRQYHKFPRARPVDLLDAWAYLEYIWAPKSSLGPAYDGMNWNELQRQYHRTHRYYGG